MVDIILTDITKCISCIRTVGYLGNYMSITLTNIIMHFTHSDVVDS